MAATKKQVALSKYNAQIEEARVLFLKEKGLKIARGFKGSPEYKRIAKNKLQWLYRYERKKVSKDIKKNKKEYKAKPAVILASGDIYHSKLSYGDKLARVIREEFQEVKDEEAAKGRKVFVEVNWEFRNPDGTTGKSRGLYTDETAVDRIFQKLYNLGLSDQAENPGTYMTIDAIQTDGEEGYYFLIDMYLP